MRAGVGHVCVAEDFIGRWVRGHAAAGEGASHVWSILMRGRRLNEPMWSCSRYPSGARVWGARGGDVRVILSAGPVRDACVWQVPVCGKCLRVRVRPFRICLGSKKA